MEIKIKVLPVANVSLANVASAAAYGQRKNPVTGKEQVHHGVDLNRLVTGQGINHKPVMAVDAGTVTVSKMQGNGGGYGNYIVIRHEGWYSLYAHLSSRQAEPGQKVKAGQAIGKVGSTGNATGPHLHFGICTEYNAIRPDTGSKWLDPLPYLKSAASQAAVGPGETGEGNQKGGDGEVKRYNKPEELPKALQGEIQGLVDSGALKGDEKGNLDITEDMARCMIVAKRYTDMKWDTEKK